jgi:hypothetical protein
MAARKRATGDTRGFLHSRVFQTVAIVLMLLAGPVAVVVGSFMMAADSDLLQNGERTSGTVTEVDDGTRASDHRFRTDYLAPDGSEQRVWADWPLDGKPAVGDVVTVIYRADDPGTAVLEGYDGPGTSVVGIGIVLTGVSLLIGTAMLVGVLLRAGRGPEPGETSKG